MSKKMKYGFSIFVVMIVLSVGAYIYLDNTLKSTLYSVGDIPIFEEVSEIENESDVIVKVRTTSNLINHMEYDEGGLPLWYWTEREVVISKPIKGEVLVDDVITVLEPYAIGENSVIGKLEIISEDYTKMVDEEEYILFLMCRDDGKYVIVGEDQGKVPITRNPSELSEGAKFPEINTKIKDKYQ